jgi:hypothetical protein
MRHSKELLDHYLPGIEIHTLVVAADFEKQPKDKPDYDQVMYRNVYLDEVPENSFLLILDSDEQLCGEIELLDYQMQLMKINQILVTHIAEIAPHKIKSCPRLILKKEGMRYHHKHDNIQYNGENILSPDYPSYRALHIGFSHHITDRYSFPDKLRYLQQARAEARSPTQ